MKLTSEKGAELVKLAGRNKVILLPLFTFWLGMAAAESDHTADGDTTRGRGVELSGFQWDGPMPRPRQVFVMKE